ncbi:uncharacterized protein LOC144467722 [Augochlora pura]
MLRHTFRTLTSQVVSSRFLTSKYSDSSTNKTSNDNIAFEADYYYKQDKELLEILKQKLQEEVKCMQDELKVMRNKMDEYNRNINENLRFLKGLEKDLSASDKK